jgi:hypothetical protein
MPVSATPLSLPNRLRAMPALRVLLVLAAILASQSSLACAMEEYFSQASIEIPAAAPDGDAPDRPADGGCCALCTDCAHSGGCCAFAASARQGTDRLSPAPLFATRPGPLAAPTSWTPPALLRPPILPA